VLLITVNPRVEPLAGLHRGLDLRRAGTDGRRPKPWNVTSPAFTMDRKARLAMGAHALRVGNRLLVGRQPCYGGRTTTTTTCCRQQGSPGHGGQNTGPPRPRPPAAAAAGVVVHAVVLAIEGGTVLSIIGGGS
jgi:hypothetical protein